MNDFTVETSDIGTYLKFSDEAIVKTKSVETPAPVQINVDYDNFGNLVGIEIV